MFLRADADNCDMFVCIRKRKGVGQRERGCVCVCVFVGLQEKGRAIKRESKRERKRMYKCGWMFTREREVHKKRQENIEKKNV
jgi:hypothetical protein